MIKGYACRSKRTDRILISIGPGLPEKHPDKNDGWFFYVPGWFHTMSIRAFKRDFGFSLKPGAYVPINISISAR